jgi:hypothetical protein
MGLFSRHPKVDPHEIASLRTDLDELRALLAASDEKRRHLEVQLTDMVGEAVTVSSHTESLNSIGATVNALAERVGETSAEAHKTSEQNVIIHQRITNVAAELTNQFGEISREIEALHASRLARPNVPPPALAATQAVAPEVLDELRQSQIRLANEQARYEIAFKQDLAVLADSLKRAR